MSSLAWMAWSWPTAIFFLLIASTLAVMTFLALRYPETPRVGALGIPTTRGDRLFISLLSAAFIHLAGVGTLGADTLFSIGDVEVSRLWAATLVSLAFATWVFRRV